jgi:uncharacterized protein (DUF1015 family)
LNKGFTDTRHIAQPECRSEVLSVFEVEHVLKNGLREERKDEFKEEFNTWNYAIRGKTLDRDKELRIAVSFSSVEGLLIITAIDINRED